MIPNAPTDNLYKFLTFLGIVLFVFCTWTITDQLLQVDREISRVESSQLTAARRVASLQSQTEALKAAQAALSQRVSSNNEAPLSREQLSELLERTDRLIQEMTQAERASIELARESDDIFPMLAEAGVLLRHHQAYAWILYFGAVFGLAMSLAGALMWYFFHQRYQDAVLRSQLDQLTTEYGSAKKSEIEEKT